jgi:hypothetical protein
LIDRMAFIGAHISPDLLSRLDRARELDRRGARSVAIRVAIELYVESVAAQVAAESRSHRNERPPAIGPGAEGDPRFEGRKDRVEA